MTSLETKKRNVLNAAKSWHRAGSTNLERRERRLRLAVQDLQKTEAHVKALEKEGAGRREAAEGGVWIDKDHNRTPYEELVGTHLQNIRRTMQVGAPHFDGICAEIERRAAAEDRVVWAQGIPFAFKGTTASGDMEKVSFRNVLTRSLEHIQIDRDGFLRDWSKYRQHRLSEEQARALGAAWGDLEEEGRAAT